MWIAGIKWRPDIWTLVLLGAIVYVWFRPPAWVSDLEQSAPALQVRLLDGRMVSMEQLRGKVVLVNFWATWCPYCRHEMPAMEAFYADYRGRGFEILALSQDDDASAVMDFMTREGYHFPVAMADASIGPALGGVSRLPTSFVIDRSGVVRHRISGQVHYARLKGLIEPLLAE
ncbi:MAG: TlpA family protein disulfide reductase [Sulfuricella denitrificans]|nr:TlpA family protein disulfide reductase [Sulfuricella denitrificans]